MKGAKSPVNARTRQTETGTARRSFTGLIGWLLVALIFMAVPAWSADLISNGGFDGATGWTFGGSGLYSTAQSNGTLTGLGSFESTANGRNTALSGTASQAASVLSGATINSISLAGMHTWGGATPNPVTVTVSLRYADATTVDIFSADLPIASTWASLTNALAGALPLTTTQSVNTLTVTVTGKNANNAAATQSAFIDDIVVDFTSSATDSLTVTSAINVSTTAQPGQADVQMMFMQINSDNTGNGNVEVTGVTMNDTYVTLAGTISSAKVHIDDNNNFLDGTLGSTAIANWNGLSTLFDLTAIPAANRTVYAGTPKFIWILYDIDALSSAGSQVQAHVTDVAVAAPDTAPISGPWDSNIVNINTGLGCGGCHPNPMVDGLARNPADGGVVGDHTKHAATQGYECTLCHLAVPLNPRHRDTFITMSEAIGNVTNATYTTTGKTGVVTDPGVSVKWPQAINPVPGNCRNTNCHGGINSAASFGGPTGSGPQWGTDNTDNCTFCHNANQTNAGGVANAYPSVASPFRSTNAAGAHAVHMVGTGGLIDGGVSCADCHVVPVANSDAGHMDELAVAPYTEAPADLVFGVDAARNSTLPVYNATLMTCTVYCHGANLPGGSTEGSNKNPLWSDNWANYSDATPTCTDACHGLPPTPTGTHSGVTYPSCNGCHADTVTDANNPPTMVASFHINGTVDASGCTGCHGTDPKQYPPVAAWGTNTTTANGVGAHVAHIEASAGFLTKATIEGTLANDWCAECHTSTRGSGGHNDGYPAEIAFSVAVESKYNGTIPSFTSEDTNPDAGVGGSCSVYCHGVNMPSGDTSGSNPTPAWGDTLTGCGICHGFPPTAGSSAATHVGKTSADCITCHPSTVANANNPPGLIADFHINGVLEASGCNGCHGGDSAEWSNNNFFPGGTGTTYPDRPGEHKAHIDALMAKLGYTIATITEAQQQSLCAYCHNDASGVGGSGHDDNVATADVGAFNNLWLAGADADGAYTPGNGTNGTCATVDCHNNNTTSPSYDWYDGVTANGACLMCHVVGGTGTVDPLSGLHRPGTLTSSMPHDDAFAGTATCTTCHSTMSAVGSGTHADGTAAGNAVAALGLTAGMYTQTSAVGNGAGTCAGGSVSAGACHGIDPIDAGSWARRWDDTISYQTNGNECAGCHGGFNNDWTFGGDNVTGDFNVSHNRDWDAAQSTNDGSEVIGNHSSTTNATRCNTCHVYADAEYVWGTYHRDRKITMNSTNGYSGTTFNCTNNCHSEGWGNTDHNLEAASSSNFTTRGNLLAGPAPGCTSCHSGHITGSAGVGNDSPHSFNSTGFTCENCHTSHTGGTIMIANNTKVGINYGTGGISLGSTTVTGATEQEICNGCHGATYQPWGVTQGGYTPGTLSNYTNWALATWTSTNFSSYKPTTIQSNHYNQAAGMSCSYCHDVHNTYGGDSATIGPYLRGSWTSNPFPEDGAPQATGPVGGNLFTEVKGPIGVPRGLGGTNTSTSNALGGWQIEQNNSGAYTRTGNYATYAGLCQLCHPADATATGILRAASFTGHAASVDGLQAGGGNDIFNDALRGGTNSYARAYMQHNGVTTMGDAPKSYIYGLREGREGNGVYPQVNDPTVPNVQTTYGMTIGPSSTSVDANFHEFPCSKCHSPHMSALPRLMITNCLDVRHNTWGDSVGGDPSLWPTTRVAHTYTASTLPYASTAANCHRYVGTADAKQETNNGSGGAGEPGWNNVTPW